MHDYQKRHLDQSISVALESAPAVVIAGPRACGKTESASQFSASQIYLDSADKRAVLAREQPATALHGETPRLLDEWQVVPEVWNEVRHEVDRRRQAGQFLLTGSATPDEHPMRHSGAGRFRRLRMRTMTLQETGDSTGEVSLAALLRGESPAIAESERDFSELIARVVRGGWPGALTMSHEAAVEMNHSYLDDTCEHDFPSVAGPRRDPRRIRAFLEAIAGLSAQPATFSAIGRRMNDAAALPIGETAPSVLHDFAERMFLTEDQPAWAPKLRSRTAALQTPKRHLCDPSLAAALLGANADRLLAEPESLGFLFESQVVHDLRVYAQKNKARGVFHYRDSKGRDEIDAVVEAADGAWIGLEVKLGQHAIDAAAENLLRVSAKIIRQPEALIVVVPSGLAYQRDDGVFVVPLTVLGE